MTTFGSKKRRTDLSNRELGSITAENMGSIATMTEAVGDHLTRTREEVGMTVEEQEEAEASLARELFPPHDPVTAEVASVYPLHLQLVPEGYADHPDFPETVSALMGDYEAAVMSDTRESLDAMAETFRVPAYIVERLERLRLSVATKLKAARALAALNGGAPKGKAAKDAGKKKKGAKGGKKRARNSSDEGEGEEGDGAEDEWLDQDAPEEEEVRRQASRQCTVLRYLVWGATMRSLQELSLQTPEGLSKKLRCPLAIAQVFQGAFTQSVRGARPGGRIDDEALGAPAAEDHWVSWSKDSRMRLLYYILVLSLHAGDDFSAQVTEVSTWLRTDPQEVRKAYAMLGCKFDGANRAILKAPLSVPKVPLRRNQSKRR